MKVFWDHTFTVVRKGVLHFNISRSTCSSSLRDGKEGNKNFKTAQEQPEDVIKPLGSLSRMFRKIMNKIEYFNAQLNVCKPQSSVEIKSETQEGERCE